MRWACGVRWRQRQPSSKGSKSTGTLPVSKYHREYSVPELLQQKQKIMQVYHYNQAIYIFIFSVVLG